MIFNLASAFFILCSGFVKLNSVKMAFIGWKNSCAPYLKVTIMNNLTNLFIALILMSSSINLFAEQVQHDIEPFSDAELEQILAPIALYPDTVLSHILVAATYPLEVIQAERWRTKNPELEGSDAVVAADDYQWDPSVKALAAFPQLLKRLSENIEWTQKLGDAFLQNESKLLASVQTLRQRAYEAGNLDRMDKVSVTHEDNAIIIEPIEEQVVYIPYYDTRVVYGAWHWAHHPPVHWDYLGHSYHHSYHQKPFHWGSSIHVSFGFFFSSFHWHDRHLVRIPRHHYRPHHYYNRHQIVRHEHARRWSHNPVHRRGASYRSVTVRNRFNSNRASRSEVRAHRVNQRSSVSSRENNARTNRRDIRDSRTRQNNHRIVKPNHIREELRNSRVSIKDRFRNDNAAANSTRRQNNFTQRNRNEATDRQQRQQRQTAPQRRRNTDSGNRATHANTSSRRSSLKNSTSRNSTSRKSSSRSSSSRNSSSTSSRNTRSAVRNNRNH